MECSQGTKRMVLQKKKTDMVAAIYDAELDLRIATRVENEKGMAAATDRMKRLEKALDLLKEEEGNLENDNGGEQGKA